MIKVCKVKKSSLMILFKETILTIGGKLIEFGRHEIHGHHFIIRAFAGIDIC